MGMYCTLRAVGADEIRRLRETPESAFDPAAGPTGNTVSLEKAWHGLHFLLSGSAWEGEGPLGFLLAGGESLGGEDSDDEPGDRFFSPDETKALDHALANVSDEQLWARFDPERMTEESIYPGIWDEAESDLREEYLAYFQAMKELIHRASSANQGILISIG